MEEIWRDIPGYLGLYQVSNFGRVLSLITNRILKFNNAGKGYLQVTLCKDGIQKNYLVHRLVAMTFIQNPNNLPQVNHRNEVKTDNRVENLEWCSCKYNMNYGTARERTAIGHYKPVYCVELDRVFSSEKEVAKELNISAKHICCVCKGRYKTTGGYHFRYANEGQRE